MFVKGAAIIVGFPSTTILLTNSATSLGILGTLNGFATTFSGVGRALGPASTGAVFTWGVDHGYVVASWFYLAAFAVAGAVPVFLIVEGDGPSSSSSSASSVDDSSDDAEDSDSSASGTLLIADGSAISDGSESDEEEHIKARFRSQGYGTINRS